MGELLAFNGDFFLGEEFLRLKEKYDITHVIETGTYHGETTKWLAEHFNLVDTIELSQTYFDIAKENLHGTHAIQHFGNSPELLKLLLGTDNTIVFLDAHWNNYNPLLDELDVIRKSGIRPIIIIHDFKVPDHPEFGFDTYPGITYDWDYIKDHVDESYNKYYNELAEGAQRGVIFLIPSWR